MPARGVERVATTPPPAAAAAAAAAGVFGPEATQEEVYGDLRPFVAPVAQGVNCTVFAYGQTGTGKTHTMLGAGAEASALVGESVDDAVTRGAGIIPRAVTDLFAALGDGRGDAVVLASFMQVPPPRPRRRRRRRRRCRRRRRRRRACPALAPGAHDGACGVQWWPHGSCTTIGCMTCWVTVVRATRRW